MADRRSLVIISIMVAVFVGALFLWVASNDEKRPGPVTEVTDKDAIQGQVELSHLSIATGENYFGHKVRVISGYLKNVSDKPVRLIEMKMVFTDWDGKPIQESVQKGYDVRLKPLQPGDQHRFEVNFENLPRSWNYHVPTVEVVKIAY